jgi:methionyl aminopeptidase
MIKSAFIHKKIVKNIYPTICEGRSIYEIALQIENEIRESCKDMNLIHDGIAFPVGVAVNHCVAHYTPFPDDSNLLLKAGDLVKIDFGIHIEGEITDSAFTIPISTNRFDSLLHISKRATMIGVEASGIDVPLTDIGEVIQEYVESKEIEMDGKLTSLKTFHELCGHSIAPYMIHSGKAVPNCKVDFHYPLRMKYGEKYAIEPFVTTGNGICIYQPPCNHFMLSPKVGNHSHSHSYAKMYAYYKSLPFTNRWLNAELLEHLERLIQEKKVETFLPIYDIEGSFVAQHEHNIFISEKKPILLTKNEYY